MPAPYANLGGASGVVAYDFDPGQPDWIEVEFASGRFTKYLYTAASCGQGNVSRMIALAQQGRGLNSFIMVTPAVKTGYASRS